MLSISKIGNCDKVKTKKELYEMLNRYKSNLSKESIEYLKSLVELEVSVYNQCISEQSRAVLTELELYRKIAIYNIYKRTEKLLKENSNGIDMEFCGNQNGFTKLNVRGKIDNSSFNIFNFDYSISDNEEVLADSDYLKNLYIGDSSLYLTKDNPELREEVLLKVLREYEQESSKKNPFSGRRGVHGGPGPMWNMQHRNKLKILEEKYNILDERKELSQTEKEIIQAQQYFYDLLLENFGLNSNDFTEPESHGMIIENEKNRMHKTLIKKYPGMKITTNINNL